MVGLEKVCRNETPGCEAKLQNFPFNFFQGKYAIDIEEETFQLQAITFNFAQAEAVNYSTILRKGSENPKFLRKIPEKPGFYVFFVQGEKEDKTR